MHVVAVTGNTRDRYAKELDQHFQLRAKIFVEELKWSDLTVKNDREVDQFDGPDAIYILAIHPQDGVVGGLRMLPTLQPTLMSAVFPHSANMANMPAGDSILEWTRFFVVPEWRAEGRQSPVSGVLFCGLFEYLLNNDIDQVRCLAETWWIPRFIGFGMQPRPLGIPIQHDRWSLTAFSFEPSFQALETLREAHGITGSVLAPRLDDGVPGGSVHV